MFRKPDRVLTVKYRSRPSRNARADSCHTTKSLYIPDVNATQTTNREAAPPMHKSGTTGTSVDARLARLGRSLEGAIPDIMRW
jgi:hypothetical protein